jgi:hypothetical protein
MLTQSNHDDMHGSRNLFAEKETVSGSVETGSHSSYETPRQGVSPVWETPRQEASPVRQIPRLLSEISSSRSVVSTVLVSPRSTIVPREDIDEPYRDVPVPIYDGARPFLGENMSPEEIARIEEEERRIDAAIAESEGARNLPGRAF